MIFRSPTHPPLDEKEKTEQVPPDRQYNVFEYVTELRSTIKSAIQRRLGADDLFG